MMYSFTNFAADSSSGLGALGIDGKAFLIQLATFILAFLVLKRYAFQPILKVLQQRRETIESSVTLAEKLRQEQAELERKAEQILHEARQQADGIIAEAQDAGRQTIREAEDKAKAKAEGILATADDRINQDMARARQGLERELVGLVSDATEAIIEEKLDAQKDARLIERLLKGRQKEGQTV
jgi:F-type H+-transporting ATPase subunit b